jgi:TPR repeat protein
MRPENESWLRKMAKEGDAEAQYNLGVIRRGPRCRSGLCRGGDLVSQGG